MFSDNKRRGGQDRSTEYILKFAWFALPGTFVLLIFTAILGFELNAFSFIFYATILSAAIRAIWNYGGKGNVGKVITAFCLLVIVGVLFSAYEERPKPPKTANPDDAVFEIIVTGQDVNIRSAPSVARSKVLGKASKDQRLPAFGIQGAYYEIAWQNRLAYISTKYCQRVE